MVISPGGLAAAGPCGAKGSWRVATCPHCLAFKQLGTASGTWPRFLRQQSCPATWPRLCLPVVWPGSSSPAVGHSQTCDPALPSHVVVSPAELPDDRQLLPGHATVACQGAKRRAAACHRPSSAHSGWKAGARHFGRPASSSLVLPQYPRAWCVQPSSWRSPNPLKACLAQVLGHMLRWEYQACPKYQTQLRWEIQTCPEYQIHAVADACYGAAVL